MMYHIVYYHIKGDGSPKFLIRILIKWTAVITVATGLLILITQICVLHFVLDIAYLSIEKVLASYFLPFIQRGELI